LANMLAAVATGPRRLQCVEVPRPEIEPGKVLVKMELTPICGSDLRAVYGPRADDFPMPPGAPGHEGVGIVVDPGDSGLEAGVPVLLMPRIADAELYAEYQTIESRQVIQLPETPPLSELVMAQQLGTVVFACKTLPPLEGKDVVVIGQGTIGLFHDFVLRGRGAGRVIAIEPRPARLALSRSMGADETIGVIGQEATDAVLELTSGEGVDVIVDAVGSIETLNQAMRIAKNDARIVAFGLLPTKEPARPDLDLFYTKSLSMNAVHGAQNQPGLPDFREALDFITRGEMDVSPLLSHRFPITRVQEAFDLAYSGEDRALKVAVSFES